MKTSEKFAKFTTEELKNALHQISEKLKIDRNQIDFFREKEDVEFLSMAEKQYREDSELYLEINSAYISR